MATTYLIDSNVLIYATNEDSEFHPQALEVVRKVLEGKIRACVAYQNLHELYAVITDPKRVERPLSPRDAREVIEFYIKARNIRKSNISNALELLKKYDVHDDEN